MKDITFNCLSLWRIGSFLEIQFYFKKLWINKTPELEKVITNSCRNLLLTSGLKIKGSIISLGIWGIYLIYAATLYDLDICDPDISLTLTYLFLPLHPSVLIPRFNLKLRKTQWFCQLHPIRCRQILMGLEFLLQTHQLKINQWGNSLFGF